MVSSVEVQLEVTSVAKVCDLEIAFVVEHEVLDPQVAVAHALR